MQKTVYDISFRPDETALRGISVFIDSIRRKILLNIFNFIKKLFLFGKICVIICVSD